MRMKQTRRAFLASAATILAAPALAQNAPRIVVVGGGFGGASAARALKKLDPRIGGKDRSRRKQQRHGNDEVYRFHGLSLNQTAALLRPPYPITRFLSWVCEQHAEGYTLDES